MKKLKMVSILTALVMLLSSMSFSVMADDGNENQNNVQLIKQWSFESGPEEWQVGKLIENETEKDTMANFKIIDGTIRADAIADQDDPQFTTTDLSSYNI